jgi:hypothetical protein
MVLTVIAVVPLHRPDDRPGSTFCHGQSHGEDDFRRRGGGLAQGPVFTAKTARVHVARHDCR